MKEEFKEEVLYIAGQLNCFSSTIQNDSFMKSLAGKFMITMVKKHYLFKKIESSAGYKKKVVTALQQYVEKNLIEKANQYLF